MASEPLTRAGADIAYVNAAILHWALACCEVSIAEVARGIGVDAERVIGWLQNEPITFDELTAFARVTETPFGYFWLATVPHDSAREREYRGFKDQGRAEVYAKVRQLPSPIHGVMSRTTTTFACRWCGTECPQGAHPVNDCLYILAREPQP